MSLDYLYATQLRRTARNGTSIHVVGGRHSRSWLEAPVGGWVCVRVFVRAMRHCRSWIDQSFGRQTDSILTSSVQYGTAFDVLGTDSSVSTSSTFPYSQ